MMWDQQCNLRRMVILVWLGIGLPAVGVTDAESQDCRLAVLQFYAEDERVRVEGVLSQLGEKHRQALLAALQESPGDGLKTIRGISRAYLSYVSDTVPEFYRQTIQEKREQLQLVPVKSTSEGNAADLRLLRENPFGAYMKAMDDRESALASIHRITLSRELYGTDVSYMINLLEEINRLVHNKTGPFWQRISILSLTNPLPIMTFGSHARQRKLATVLWGYLTLIPRASIPLVQGELEVQKRHFLSRMKPVDGQKRIKDLFDQVEQLLQDILVYPTQESFELAQAKKFRWGKELLVDYTFKAIWYVIIAIAIYAHSIS